MTGKQLKDKLNFIPISLAELSTRLGITPQALNQTFKSSDVKSGIIEGISKALCMPIHILFEEDIEKFRLLAIGNQNQQNIYGGNNMGDAGLKQKVDSLEREVADLRSQLADKERIIKLLEAHVK